MLRLTRFVFAAAVALAVPAIGTVGERAARADDDRADGDAPSAIAVGTELEATADVTLHQAEIAKGSKVSVTKVLGRSGQVDGVSVALADGHVVKVTMTQVHSYFRVVKD